MYISGNYKKVKDEIENRRLSAVATAELHNEEVRARSAEIREIDAELTELNSTNIDIVIQKIAPKSMANTPFPPKLLLPILFMFE